MAAILRNSRERCVILHTVLSSGGLELARFPEFVDCNKLDKGVQLVGVLSRYKYIIFGQTLIILHNISLQGRSI